MKQEKEGQRAVMESVSKATLRSLWPSPVPSSFVPLRVDGAQGIRRHEVKIEWRESSKLYLPILEKKNSGTGLKIFLDNGCVRKERIVEQTHIKTSNLRAPKFSRHIFLGAHYSSFKILSLEKIFSKNHIHMWLRHKKAIIIFFQNYIYYINQCTLITIHR